MNIVLYRNRNKVWATVTDRWGNLEAVYIGRDRAHVLEQLERDL